MLTDKEKGNLASTISAISDRVDGMIVVIDGLSGKAEVFSQIISSIRKVSRNEAKAQLDSLLDVKAELIELRDRIKILLNVDMDISEAYKAFLQSEFVAYDWDNMPYANDSLLSMYSMFIKQQNDTYIKPIDVQTANQIGLLPEHFTRNMYTLRDKVSALVILDKIKTITGNIVMVGANGSGKSTLSRQLQGRISSNGLTILSAQHLLIYSRTEVIPSSGNEIQAIREYQRQDKLGNDPNSIRYITSDLNNLVNALLSQHIQSAVDYQAGEPQKGTLLEKTVSLWHELIEHRSLIITGSGISVETPDGQRYGFNNLSDGEKAVFYYIGHILLATESSYILVDEPENHLHLAICNKLWDRLEALRTDCSFIYLTHNLDFAMSRTKATTIWNKRFTAPSQWDFDILESDSTIPDGLLMEIAGSRKNICFCEGQDKDSIDYKLYSILLKEYTVIPAGGHRKVIDYTCAYNESSLFMKGAIGIIDGDCHLPEQLSAWAEKGIFTLSVNEVENLLCDEIILSAAIEQFHSGDAALSNYYTMFWKCFEDDKEQQAIWYVNNYLNNRFKENFLHEKRNIGSLKTELRSITSDEEVDLLYEKRIQMLSEIISQRDYQKGLCLVDFKGKLTGYIVKTTIVDKYVDRVLDLLKKNNELANSVRGKYFSFLYGERDEIVSVDKNG